MVLAPNPVTRHVQNIRHIISQSLSFWYLTFFYNTAIKILNTFKTLCTRNPTYKCTSHKYFNISDFFWSFSHLIILLFFFSPQLKQAFVLNRFWIKSIRQNCNRENTVLLLHCHRKLFLVMVILFKLFTLM